MQRRPKTEDNDIYPSGGPMRKRSFAVVAAILLLQFAPIRADERATAANTAKVWDALWRFDTHG